MSEEELRSRSRSRATRAPAIPPRVRRRCVSARAASPRRRYVIGMLLLFEDIDQDKVDLLRAQFAEHDKDGSGKLDRADLAIIAREKDVAKARRVLVLRGLRGDELERTLALEVAETDARDERKSSDEPPLSGPELAVAEKSAKPTAKDEFDIVIDDGESKRPEACGFCMPPIN